MAKKSRLETRRAQAKLEDAIREQRTREYIAAGHSGDTEAYWRAAELNIGLARRIAGAMTPRSHTFEDLVQEGMIGLAKAAERFDLNKTGARGEPARFSTYANHWVFQAIVRAIKGSDRLIYLPAHVYADLAQLTRFQDEFASSHSRLPTSEEIAAHCGWEPLTVEALLKSQLKHASLDHRVGNDPDSDRAIERIPDPHAPDPARCARSDRLMIEKLLNDPSISDKERRVVKLRFGWDDGEVWTLDRIAIYGGIGHNGKTVTREWVRQVEARTLRKLKRLVLLGKCDRLRD